MNKVILAYSGGLYSSLILHWLKNKKGYEVVAFMAELGSREERENLEEKAMDLGASEVVVADVLEDFARHYIFPTLRANAKYESRYMFSTALSRPLIIREMVRGAFNLDCDFLAHACAPNSNDSIRFKTIATSLSSDIEVISPLEKWGLNNFTEIKRYIKRHNLNLSPFKESDRVDENIWGRIIKNKKLMFDGWTEPPEEVFTLTQNPLTAPDEPTMVEIGFHQGIPTHLDGEEKNPVELLTELNQVGGANGVGRIMALENMLTGMKSRELYEAPAAAILYQAHQSLEELTLPKDLLYFKAQASRQYARLIYQGLWFCELRTCLDSFFQQSQKFVSGKVKLQLYKGNCTVLGSDSPHSLFKRRRTQGPSSSQGLSVEFAQIPSLLQNSQEGESVYMEE